MPIGAAYGAIRMQLRVCIDCDTCDQLHGAQLQGVLFKAVADGNLAPYTAIARAMIDDAQLTGRIVHDVKEGRVVDITIPNPPPRWMVAVGRAMARGEQPDVQTLVDAVLARYIGGQNTPALMAEMRIELRDALQFVDPSIMDVEVSATMTALDPGNLRIEITAKTPTLGSTMAGADDADIPPDIMSRPRAEA
ncbi:MAG TPA: hypothetical protein VMZ53_03760 [Kofleriaceae bacterium]|nr:hypothetical protein [Kofleriaceae bacterium]